MSTLYKSRKIRRVEEARLSSVRQENARFLRQALSKIRCKFFKINKAHKRSFIPLGGTKTGLLRPDEKFAQHGARFSPTQRR